MENCYIEWLDGDSWVRYGFDVDPTSAAWGYSMRTQKYDTYGGRVVQVLSCSIDSLEISGTLRQPRGIEVPRQFSGHVVSGTDFGAYENRYAVMEEFADAMRQCMECQGESKVPSRFRYPMLDWDGSVYLTSYGNVTYDVSTAAATYTLKFEIDNGFDTIREAVSDYGLDAIPDGVNWTRNVYNTPVTTWSDVRQALELLLQDAGTSARNPSLYEYLDEVRKHEESASSQASAEGGSKPAEEAGSSSYVSEDEAGTPIYGVMTRVYGLSNMTGPYGSSYR